MNNKTCVFRLSVLCSAMFATVAFAADSSGEPGRSSGKPNPLNNVYFGEHHLTPSHLVLVQTPTTPTVMPRAKPSRTPSRAR